MHACEPAAVQLDAHCLDLPFLRSSKGAEPVKPNLLQDLKTMPFVHPPVTGQHATWPRRKPVVIAHGAVGVQPLLPQQRRASTYNPRRAAVTAFPLGDKQLPLSIFAVT